MRVDVSVWRAIACIPYLRKRTRQQVIFDLGAIVVIAD